MAAGKSGSRGLKDLEERPAKDYDPEGDASQSHLDGSESEASEDDLAGTEHYVSVGKSKLRQRNDTALGPQYRGARISRAALEESGEESSEDAASDEDEDASGDESGSEEFADPDTADLEADQDDEDAEIESDNALCESDAERFKDFTFRGSSKPKDAKGKRMKAADFFSASEEEEEDEGAPLEEWSDGDSETSLNGARLSDDEDEDSEGESEGEGLIDDEAEETEDDEGSDEDDDEDDGERDRESDEDASEDDNDEDADDERAELRKIMSEGQKSILATMSQAAKADAEKGIAVRQQRRAFDSLLNIRIRLQKALVAANSFSVVDDAANGDMAEQKQPYEAAEEAAIKLWSTIDGFRRTLLPESAKAKIGQKRKRDFDVESTDDVIWQCMEETEELAMAHRRKVLDKWSAKVRNTIATTTTRKLGPAAASQSLVSVLDDQLLSADRLVKRTRTPRSCAPAQAAKKVAEDADIYDDADFYQLLLKELVDQRTMDSTAGGNGSGGATVRWAALKEAKTRKQVDRKASKGRKLRYTVHEKLQNFMAPEDRRTWEQDAIDRFFGTLFGQKMELNEEAESDEEMGGVSVEEQGLRLFGGS